ncbi:uncharacterized protein LOC127956169 [Carassius gibelio]|uniref:uncharacterized protein LOC127956169 n=1 Tax=Carassius gibelio TaxID=101364 RepID=UPI0022798698|nr:uncharacterized protein LOC127956169 [Carassius gibelio]
MAFIKEESEDMRMEEAFRGLHEDTETQTKMAFIKEECEDTRIEETFKHKDTEDQTDNYEEGKRKVREVEVQSDIQSDTEEPGRKKVRRKRPHSQLLSSFSMDSEEEDALQQDSTGFPAAPPVQQFNRPTKEVTFKTISLAEMLTSNHTIWQPEDLTYESPQEPTRSLFPESGVSWNSVQQTPEISACLHSAQPEQTQLHKQQRTHQSPTPELIVSLIREMLTKQEMILDQQQSILRILNAKQSQDTDYVIEHGLLPVKDLLALNMLEQKLRAVDFKEKLINHLGLVGGFDTKDTVWRTMQRTISNDLAKSINWRGVNGKISLAALQIKDVVIDAVRKNVFSSTATNSEIENVMKRWLHLASDRDGGRKRRQKD